MKRFAFFFAMLAMATMAAVAVGAPAPKTTGGIGYNAYGVERHLTFNAIQTDTGAISWNVAGVTSLSFILDNDPIPGTVYTHAAALAQAGQAVTGSGGYPAGGPFAYAWHVTGGSVVGNVLDLTVLYDVGAPGTVMHITATIAPNGSISGTWDDNLNGGHRTGTVTGAGAVATFKDFAKGNVSYSDEDGLWYRVDVKALSVDAATGDAWFAGPVVAGNVGAGAWLFAKVHDGGEPAVLVDQVWGSFTDRVTAVTGVIAHATPADGPFTVTSGNLQVHQ